MRRNSGQVLLLRINIAENEESSQRTSAMLRRSKAKMGESESETYGGPYET